MSKSPLTKSKNLVSGLSPSESGKYLLLNQVLREINNSWFSHDVTAAMLEPLNKETAAMLEPRPNPPGI